MHLVGNFGYQWDQPSIEMQESAVVIRESRYILYYIFGAAVITKL